MVLRQITLFTWDSVPEHPLPGTQFQNILYLGLRSRTSFTWDSIAVLTQRPLPQQLERLEADHEGVLAVVIQQGPGHKVSHLFSSLFQLSSLN